MPVRSAWPGRGAAQRRIAAFARQVMVECIGAHDLGPLRPFGVGDFDGHRRAEGQAVAYTGQQTDLVLLELHAGTATISKSTACQCGNDIVRANTTLAGNPSIHGHQRLSVVPCRLPTQHNFPRFMCVRLCVRLTRVNVKPCHTCSRYPVCYVGLHCPLRMFVIGGCRSRGWLRARCFRWPPISRMEW